MKKLVLLISVILCAVMLTMSVTAGTPEEEDPYKLFKKAIDKTAAAKTLEMKGVLRATDLQGQSIVPAFAIITKFVAVSGDDSVLQMECLVWEDGDDEYLIQLYEKDGYLYSATRRTVWASYRSDYKSEMRNELYSFLRTDSETYTRDLVDLSVEKLEGGGYRLRYKMENTSSGDYSNYSFSDSVCTLTLNDDYTFKSFYSYYYDNTDDSRSRHSSKYDFAVNDPVTIDFPRDLGSYTAVK